MKEKLTVIIDYKLGNLFSVKHACDHVGLRVITSNDVEVIRKADALILPGVGAFGEAMNNINQLNLQPIIKERVEAGVPLLGVCLGLQLLLSLEELKYRGFGFVAIIFSETETSKSLYRIMINYKN